MRPLHAANLRVVDDQVAGEGVAQYSDMRVGGNAPLRHSHHAAESIAIALRLMLE
jgi:hypothetical protein